MESRVLPAAEINAILASKFVCVKVNIDSPDGQAQKIPFNYNRVVKDNRGEGNVTLKSGDVVVVP